jgi:RimJ/RimL family protein N-acetyltransferase
MNAMATELKAPAAGVAVWPLTSDDIETAAGWLRDPRNAQWLDFGSGMNAMSSMTLKLWTQRGHHAIWVFGPPEEKVPVGLVALGNIHPRFRTAEAWGVLGDKRYGTRDLTGRATALLLDYGFSTLGLESIYAWTVEINRGGRRLIERMGFRFMGRQRKSHRIGERSYDRLWFDLVPEEFRGFSETWR